MVKTTMGTERRGVANLTAAEFKQILNKPGQMSRDGKKAMNERPSERGPSAECIHAHSSKKSVAPIITSWYVCDVIKWSFNGFFKMRSWRRHSAK